MEDNRHIWLCWINYLHRWGLTNLAKALLENMGSLGFIVAELSNFFQPAFDEDHFQKGFTPLIALLTDEKNRTEFLQCMDEREKVMR